MMMTTTRRLCTLFACDRLLTTSEQTPQMTTCHSRMYAPITSLHTHTRLVTALTDASIRSLVASCFVLFHFRLTIAPATSPTTVDGRLCTKTRVRYAHIAVATGLASYLVSIFVFRFFVLFCAQMDVDKLTPAELAILRAEFDAIDADKNGQLTVDEIRSYFQSQQAAERATKSVRVSVRSAMDVRCDFRCDSIRLSI